MYKRRVAVLRGGPSSEYEVSLKTGAAVLRNLDVEKYTPIDILIDRKGVWHMRGFPKEVSAILPQVDVVFNAMHGEYGEDGTVQKILDRFNVRYTGSVASSSALCMNKILTKGTLVSYKDELEVKLPRHVSLSPEDDLMDKLEEIFRTFPRKMVVKPIVGGSSVGVVVVDSFGELSVVAEKAFEKGAKIFVEEYIEGKEATCGVIERFRGEDVYALLPIEIIPPKEHPFFTYEAKYDGISEEICPGNFSTDEKDSIQSLAREIHKLLGLRHYSRSDFIVSTKGIYFLEVNTLPGLTEESLMPKALTAVGSTFPEFLDHIISIA